MHFRIVGFYESSGEGVDLLVDAPDPKCAHELALGRGIRIDTIDPASPPTYADEAPRLSRRVPGESGAPIRFTPPSTPLPEKPIIITRRRQPSVTPHPWLPYLAIIVTALILLTLLAGLWAVWHFWGN